MWRFSLNHFENWQRTSTSLPRQSAKHLPLLFDFQLPGDLLRVRLEAHGPDTPFVPVWSTGHSVGSPSHSRKQSKSIQPISLCPPLLTRYLLTDDYESSNPGGISSPCDADTCLCAGLVDVACYIRHRNACSTSATATHGVLYTGPQLLHRDMWHVYYLWLQCLHSDPDLYP